MTEDELRELGPIDPAHTPPTLQPADLVARLEQLALEADTPAKRTLVLQKAIQATYQLLLQAAPFADSEAEDAALMEAFRLRRITGPAVICSIADALDPERDLVAELRDFITQQEQYLASQAAAALENPGPGPMSDKRRKHLEALAAKLI